MNDKFANETPAFIGNSACIGTSTSIPHDPTKCWHCGNHHSARCPKIKAIEFHADGITTKRIEYFE
jgi:hypothetical protein